MRLVRCWLTMPICGRDSLWQMGQGAAEVWVPRERLVWELVLDVPCSTFFSPSLIFLWSMVLALFSWGCATPSGHMGQTLPTLEVEVSAFDRSLLGVTEALFFSGVQEDFCLSVKNERFFLRGGGGGASNVPAAVRLLLCLLQ